MTDAPARSVSKSGLASDRLNLLIVAVSAAFVAFGLAIDVPVDVAFGPEAISSNAPRC